MLCAAIAGFATVVHTGNTWLGRYGRGGIAGGHLRCAGHLAQHQPVRHGLVPLCLAPAFRRSQVSVTCRKTARATFAVPFWLEISLGPAVVPAASAGVPTMPLGGAGVVPVSVARRFGCARWAKVARIGPRAGLPGAASGCWLWWRAARCAGWPGLHLYRFTPLWVEGMVAGRGWIALALTTFATWRPARYCLARTCLVG